MEAAVYILCAITALLVAIVLLRGFARSRRRLLLHAGLCFSCLMLSNVLLFVDRIVLPDIDLSLWPTLAALLGMGILLCAMIFDGDHA
jgi:CHASE2 domain-containing sensor protein